MTLKVFLLLVKGMVVLSEVTDFPTHPTPPDFPKIGCPNQHQIIQNLTMTRHEDYCFSKASCIPNKFNFPTVPKNNNVYKTIKARSWWFCGMACDPTTPCKYWTYRHAHRTCYLLKSCCFSEGDKSFQSGAAGCPQKAKDYVGA